MSINLKELLELKQLSGPLGTVQFDSSLELKNYWIAFVNFKESQSEFSIVWNRLDSANQHKGNVIGSYIKELRFELHDSKFFENYKKYNCILIKIKNKVFFTHMSSLLNLDVWNNYEGGLICLKVDWSWIFNSLDLLKYKGNLFINEINENRVTLKLENMKINNFVELGKYLEKLNSI